MAEQHKPIDGLDEVNEALSKTEQAIEKYQKPILITVAVAVVVISLILCIRQFHFIPKEARAQDELFKGEFYFQTDSFRIAVNGNGGDYMGFEAIIDENGSTKAGNLAKAYAGICYMRLGEYDKAIKHLKGFSANDILISPALIGAIGDCYVETGNVKEGISFFEKAATKADNELLSPIYLKKADIAYKSMGNETAALKVYQTIKDKWSTSMEAADIDKYIERASLKK